MALNEVRSLNDQPPVEVTGNETSEMHCNVVGTLEVPILESAYHDMSPPTTESGSTTDPHPVAVLSEREVSHFQQRVSVGTHTEVEDDVGCPNGHRMTMLISTTLYSTPTSTTVLKESDAFLGRLAESPSLSQKRLRDILTPTDRRVLQFSGLDCLFDQRLPTTATIRDLARGQAFGYCYTVSVRGVWKLLMMLEVGRTPTGNMVAQSGVLLMARDYRQVERVKVTPGEPVGHVEWDPLGLDPLDAFRLHPNTIFGGENTVEFRLPPAMCENARQAADKYRSSLGSEVPAGELVFPTYDNTKMVITMDDLDWAVILGHSINWSLSWARLQGTHTFIENDDVGMKLWQIVADPKYNDLTLTSYHPPPRRYTDEDVLQVNSSLVARSLQQIRRSKPTPGRSVERVDQDRFRPSYVHPDSIFDDVDAIGSHNRPNTGEDARRAAIAYRDSLKTRLPVGELVFPTYNRTKTTIRINDLDRAAMLGHSINWSLSCVRLQRTHTFIEDGDSGMKLWRLVTDPKYQDFVLTSDITMDCLKDRDNTSTASSTPPLSTAEYPIESSLIDCVPNGPVMCVCVCVALLAMAACTGLAGFALMLVGILTLRISIVGLVTSLPVTYKEGWCHLGTTRLARHKRELVLLGPNPSLLAYSAFVKRFEIPVTKGKGFSVDMERKLVHFEDGNLTYDEVLNMLDDPIPSDWRIGARLRPGVNARVTRTVQRAMWTVIVHMGLLAFISTSATITYIRSIGPGRVWEIKEWLWALFRGDSGMCYQLLVDADLGRWVNWKLIPMVATTNNVPTNAVRLSLRGKYLHVEEDPKGIRPFEIIECLRLGFAPINGVLVPLDTDIMVGGKPWRTRMLSGLAWCIKLLSCLVIGYTTIGPIIDAGLGLSLFSLFTVLSGVSIIAAIGSKFAKPYKASLVTAGSMGDKISPFGISIYARNHGLDLKFVDATPGFAGDYLLRAAELGEIVMPTWLSMTVIESVRAEKADGRIVYTPAMLPVISDGVFAVTAHPNVIKGFKYPICNSPLFEAITELKYGTTPIDFRFDSSSGSVPRYARKGGCLMPLREESNLATTKKTLVCLGSSSIDEPPNLDPSTTWSTNPSSRYQYEPNTSHLDAFRNYSTVICHGGAGTVDTARACGCKVVSVSKTLDRDILDEVERDFSVDEAYIFVALVAKCPLPMFLDLFRKYPWRSANCRTSLAFIVATIKYLVTRTLALASLKMYLTALFVRSIIAEGSVTNLLASNMEGALISPWIATALAAVIVDHAPQLMQFDPARAFMTKYYLLGLSNLSQWIQDRSTLTGMALVSVFGTLPGFLIYALCENGLIRMMDGVPISAFSVIQFMSTLDVSFARDIHYSDNVYVSFQVMDCWWTGYLPLNIGHVKFYNPQTKMAVGITCDDDMRCAVQVEDNPKIAKREFVFNTKIPLEKWDLAVDHVWSYNGKPYCPIRHCAWSVWRAVRTLQKGESLTVEQQNQLNLFLVMAVFSSVVMTIAGTTLLPLGLLAGIPMVQLTPAITFAGRSNGFGNWRSLWKFLAGASRLLTDGPTVINNSSKYPLTRPSQGPLFPTDLRLMRLNIGGEDNVYLPPMCGMNRPNYTRGRGACYNYVHNLTEEGIATKTTTRQIKLMKFLRREVLERSFNGELIAVVATTPERPIQPEVLELMTDYFDDYIVLTNSPCDLKHIAIDATGRELATLRLAMPPIKGVVWFSLNAAYDTMAIRAVRKLRMTKQLLLKSSEPVSFSSHGLNPGPAGFVAYRQPIMTKHSIDFDIYGCEEWEMTRHPMTVFVEMNFIMFNTVRAEQDFPCKRKIVFYNSSTLCDEYVAHIERWNIDQIIHGLSEATRPSRVSVGIDRDGLVVNGKPALATPIISDLYAQPQAVEAIVDDITTNVGAFVTRVKRFATASLKDAKHTPICREVIMSYYNVISCFNRKGREPKGLWAPVIGEIRKSRVEELKVAIHPNPVFVKADFDSTISHYVKHLNLHQQSDRHLNPTSFRRRVNRSPYVDSWLKEKLPDAHEAGIDASTIACREVMLASLARYNKGGLVDAMTDQDISGIVEAIYKQNRDMLCDAHVADPMKLTKKFLSFKKYSAGLPFTYDGSAISKRADLRRQGWLKPIAELGLLPYKTGEWYPAIAHAFPKSQVVSRQKIEKNPGKMRTIVATAGFNNVQQGVLNFEINNRHDFMGSNEKVAMPLNGSHMNYIFEDVSGFDYVYSLDATAMDANLSDGVLQIIADLRKKGFEDHPAYDAICKHIDCAMEQTKHSFVVNLVTDRVYDVPAGTIATDLAEWASGIDYSSFQQSRLAPGGVLAKKAGGSTGDSNVTFNNTKGLPIVLMYAYCKASNIGYDKFFDEVGLHNFGDDDILATSRPPSFMKKVVQIAKRDLGIELRFEAEGTNVMDQVFLGRRPKDPLDYIEDFQEAGIRMPKYAIVNDTATMEMRLASEKAEMTRHKGLRHELYRLEKAMGYALLCAHQRDFYTTIEEYFTEVVSRVPINIQSQPWFKKKYKLTPYVDVIRKWYKPIDPTAYGVHALQFEIGLVARTEKAFLRCLHHLGWLAELFPSHLVSPESQTNSYRVSELHCGIFEAHAWHTFVKEFGEVPTLEQLESRVSQSPYSQYANCDYWLRTKGKCLPTTGPLFERNANHAMWKVILFTAVYVNLNRTASLLDRLPLGNVLIEMANLCLFKSRKLFGTLGYAHYIAKGKGSPKIDSLAPKDPYTYHKRAAALVMNSLPDFALLSYIPIGWAATYVTTYSEIVAETTTLTVGDNGNAEHLPERKPWRRAYYEALEWMEAGNCPVLVSHTGTGKTRNLPPIALFDPDHRWDQVVVVMPRNIVCYEWCRTSGALFKRRKTPKTQALMCCTYGYLAHCYANGNTWWSDTTLFIFDEAHEESVEWRYLRTQALEYLNCFAMTATPDALTCASFQRIDVDVKPKHKIKAIQADSIDSAIANFCPGANRFLIIEPSLRRCRQICDRITATGYAAKVVHSGDRDIPENVHIVATSVVEASITIPGCDLVIDTGERLVTDGGTGLWRVPNTIPGMIQRKGRTGRTNDGLYVYITAPVNKEYEPLPDVGMVLENHKITQSISPRVPFDPAPNPKRLPGDNYAHVPSNLSPTTKMGLGLMHRLLSMQKHSDVGKALHEYAACRRGNPPDECAHLLDTFSMEDIPPSKEILGLYTKYTPAYYRNGVTCGNRVVFENYKLVANFERLQPEGEVQTGQLDTARATPVVKQEFNSKSRQVNRRDVRRGAPRKRAPKHIRSNTSAV